MILSILLIKVSPYPSGAADTREVVLQRDVTIYEMSPQSGYSCCVVNFLAGVRAYIYSHIHRNICTHTSTYPGTPRAYIYTHIHTNICTHSSTYPGTPRAYIYTHIHTNILGYTCTHILTLYYMSKKTCIHIHIETLYEYTSS